MNLLLLSELLTVLPSLIGTCSSSMAEAVRHDVASPIGDVRSDVWLAPAATKVAQVHACPFVSMEPRGKHNDLFLRVMSWIFSPLGSLVLLQITQHACR